MATSVYFNNYNGIGEQRLIEDLIVESIKIQGFDCHYIPNTNSEARDLIYGEDPLRQFTTNYPVEMYLSSSMEYGGQKEFFSKFGLEIRNNVSVIVSKRSFSQRVPQNTYTRPQEGDLIYIPFLNGTGELFEIKFVNQTKDFFMLGRKVPYFYELELEKFKYSQEVIATGNIDIDDVVVNTGYITDLNVSNGTGNYLYQEKVFQGNDVIASTWTGTVQSWDAVASVLKVSNTTGSVTNALIHGASSGAVYQYYNYNAQHVDSPQSVYDNEITSIHSNIVDKPSGPGSI